jgi:molybdopterin converting factor small subunit
MIVKIILHSILREKLPPENRGRTQLILNDGSTIQDVISLLKLPEPVMASLNTVFNRDLNSKLSDGDELRLFRPGAGG